MIVDNLKTGDIMLITNSESGIFNYFLNMIKYGTHSDYVHIGMIVKDPDFLDTPLKGLYLWESSYEGTPDPQDGIIKLGVQLTKLSDVFDNYDNAEFYIRRLKDTTIFTTDKLKEIHNIVYDIPYDIDPMDWFYAFFRKDKHPQKLTRMWCSSFIGYIFTFLNIIKKDTDWSIMYPCDFALDGENLNYVDKEKNSLELWENKLDISQTILCDFFEIY